PTAPSLPEALSFFLVPSSFCLPPSAGTAACGTMTSVERDAIRPEVRLQPEPTETRQDAQERGKSLLPEVKARPPQEAAAFLAEHPTNVIAGVLLDLNPALTQDILNEFPRGLADAVLQSVSPVIAMQWERNAAYARGTIGRLMEPVIAVFRPQQTVG